MADRRYFQKAGQAGRGRGRPRTLETALLSLNHARPFVTKVLVNDDGSFRCLAVEGEPNFISVPHARIGYRRIVHRYIKTGLYTKHYPIYVLYEVTGDDLDVLLRGLGRQPAPEAEGDDAATEDTSWLPGHRRSRADAGYGRKRRIPVVGADREDDGVVR